MSGVPDPTVDPSPAGEFARALLRALIGAGVRDLVLCPGSRSQALALAAAELEASGALRLRVRIDERVAGFLALGLARESGRPVPVVVTSGTAVAELHPAVLEASHSGVPLVVLSADRPDELRGTGANQTTVQPGMFGSAVAVALDVEAPDADTDVGAEARRIAAAVAGATGPVHVNLAFREPLSDAVSGPAPEVPEVEPSLPAGSAPVRPASALLDPVLLDPDAATVVIAGAGAGEEAEELARALGAPLLAEVVSGARFGPNLVAAYRELLDEPGFGDAIRRAVVVGHPTLSRQVPALLRRDDVETVVVRGSRRDVFDPTRGRARVVDAVAVDPAAPRPEGERAWVGRWVHGSRALLETEQQSVASIDDSPAAMAAWGRREVARLRAPVSRRELVEAVWAATWPHDRLVLGASRLVRVLDQVATGKRLRVHANRGLAGIDGTVSTAIGVALAAEAGTARTDPALTGPGRTGTARTGTTRVLLGDLALLHDSGALLFPDGEPRPRVQVVVGNDRGGTIFDGLEVAATAPAAAIDRVLYTPQSADLAALAAAFGWTYRRVATRGELDQALGAALGPELVEVELAR